MLLLFSLMPGFVFPLEVFGSFHFDGRLIKTRWHRWSLSFSGPGSRRPVLRREIRLQVHFCLPWLGQCQGSWTSWRTPTEWWQLFWTVIGSWKCIWSIQGTAHPHDGKSAETARLTFPRLPPCSCRLHGIPPTDDRVKQLLKFCLQGPRVIIHWELKSVYNEPSFWK